MQDYLDSLDRQALRDRFYGLYIYGSIPLGAFDEITSDIDLIALTHDDLAPDDLDKLETLHGRLGQEHELGNRLAVMYIPLRDLGKRNAEVLPYPYAADGEFHRSGHFDLNGVAWWLVKHHGIALLGPEPGALQLATSWDDVLEDMRYNLNSYWARNHAGLAARPDIVLDDYSVVYIVSTLCRILSTVEDGGIPTKPQALSQWHDRLPAQYRRLIDEALHINRHADAQSLYQSASELREDMLSFLAYSIERGNRTLAR